MSRGLVCDQCGDVLVTNERGDDENGESSAWLKLVTSFGTYDLCSRSCATALLDDENFVEAHDATVEAVAEIARMIRGDGDDDE